MKSTSVFTLAVVLFLSLPASSSAGTQDDTMIALHLVSHAAKSAAACDPWDVPCSGFRTYGTVGEAYDAYLVVAGADPGPGLAGISCGIDYESQSGHGVDAFSWTFCGGGLEFKNYGENGRPWPDAGSGNRMTWDLSEDCPRDLISGHEDEGVHLVAGSFYLYAYSNDVFAITPNRGVSAQGELAVADCAALVTDLDPVTAVGSLHFSHEGGNHGYNPCTGVGDPAPDPDEPPPPPPDPEPRPEPTEIQSASFMLHVTPVDNPRAVCDEAPLRKTDVLTAASSQHNGSALYYVYLLGTPRTYYDDHYGELLLKNDGLQAIRFGIDYDQGNGQGNDDPLRVFSWNSCGASGGPLGTWPAPMSGNTLILNQCQPSEIVSFGYFYLAAYAPSTMSLVGFPTSGKVEYSSCTRTQEFIPVDPVQVGWVSLHGGSIGLDTDGCNPAVEPCNASPTPARPTTWGQLKNRYKVDPQ